MDVRNQKYQTSLKTHSELEKELNLYQDSLEISSFGLYSPQFNFDTSKKFKDQNAGWQKPCFIFCNSFSYISSLTLSI
jgi:hypothetical protein